MKHLAILCFSILVPFAFTSCNDGENDLLKPKLYFEESKTNIEIENVDTYNHSFTSRVSKSFESDVNVSYTIGGEDLVKQYNDKNGTKYLLLPTANYSLSESIATIKSGDLYTKPVVLSMKNLLSIKDGETYLIPIVVNGNLAGLPSQNVTYLVVKKPVVINKVCRFSRSHWLDVRLPEEAKEMKSLTYEALIYTSSYQRLSTIMGNEGMLIMRFSDLGHDPRELQMAGAVALQIPNPSIFQANKWYHVAFTYDEGLGVAKIYVNAEKIVEKSVGKKSFDLASRFCIGYAYDYDSFRNWNGYMSECRLWKVARNESELRENMMSVDPASNGLMGYWKLNGSDIEQRSGKYYIKDQSPNHNDALSLRGYRGEDGRTQGPSVEPDVKDITVKLK